MTKTKEISIDKLRLHPNNIRKTYRDLSELTASIREVGILQNLTVVPIPDEEGFYHVVIGNRRYQAAKKAGLATVPCVIVEMDEAEQALTMLTENLQRNDLTIIEEAAGYQMCFSDFGIDVGTLAKKTGFSKSTVRHRLNVAKLDQDVLQEKLDDPSFQLSFTDIQRLERIHSINKRNEVLENAEDSKELDWMVEQAVKAEEQERKCKKLIALAKKESIPEAPQEVIAEQYYRSRWDLLLDLSANDDLPEHLLDEEDREKYPDGIYYISEKQCFKILARRPEPKAAPVETSPDNVGSTAPTDSSTATASGNEAENTSANGAAIASESSGTDTSDSANTVTAAYTLPAPELPEETGPTREELMEQDRQSRIARYEELSSYIQEDLTDFCHYLIDGRVEAPEDFEGYVNYCWNLLLRCATVASDKAVAATILNKRLYSVTYYDLHNLPVDIYQLPVYTQMLAIIRQTLYDCTLMNSDAEYIRDNATALREFYDLLSMLGFSFSDPALEDVMNGTHAVYQPLDLDAGEENPVSGEASEADDSSEIEASGESEAQTSETDDSSEIEASEADDYSGSEDSGESEVETSEADNYSEIEDSGESEVETSEADDYSGSEDSSISDVGASEADDISEVA